MVAAALVVALGQAERLVQPRLGTRKLMVVLAPGAHPTDHSDRGCQYCCHEYVAKLTARGLATSMMERDHGAENALAERVNGIRKGEYGLGGEAAEQSAGAGGPGV